MPRFTIAYPGTLGVPTDKGMQDVKPLPLEAHTENYQTMLLRWQTGAFELGASPPVEDMSVISGFPVYVVDEGGIPVTQVNGVPGLGGPVATVSENGFGLSITLVETGGVPMMLFNTDGTLFTSVGGLIRTLTVLRDSRVMRENQRMTDNG